MEIKPWLQEVIDELRSNLTDGEDRKVWKDPVTDPGKSSKSGKLRLVFNDGYYKGFPKGYRTVGESGWQLPDKLRLVYENGFLYNRTTLDEVRERANIGV